MEADAAFRGISLEIRCDIAKLESHDNLLRQSVRGCRGPGL